MKFTGHWYQSSYVGRFHSNRCTGLPKMDKKLFLSLAAEDSTHVPTYVYMMELIVGFNLLSYFHCTSYVYNYSVGRLREYALHSRCCYNMTKSNTGIMSKSC